MNKALIVPDLLDALPALELPFFAPVTLQAPNVVTAPAPNAPDKRLRRLTPTPVLSSVISTYPFLGL
jgi:hypothetical protein